MNKLVGALGLFGNGWVYANQGRFQITFYQHLAHLPVQVFGRAVLPVGRLVGGGVFLGSVVVEVNAGKLAYNVVFGAVEFVE